MYTQGQAVIFKCPNFTTMLFVIGDSDWENEMYAVDIKGKSCNLYLYQNNETNSRAATEAEILEHIQLHGWEYIDGDWYSPSQQLWIFKNFPNEWDWNNIFKIKDLSIFGNECIVADRLIKALNLTKP